MKKPVFYLIALMAVFFVACSSDDDKNDTKINLDPNVSDTKLDNKSGGVYFASSLAGEYIFRVNLKNGDDAITCDMFHNDEYLELAPTETTWQPGEALDDLEFSNSSVKLILSLNEDGEGEAQLFVEEKEFETVLFKSTSKKAVIIYSGTVSNFNSKGLENPDNVFDQIMIIQNDEYFYGLLERGSEDYSFGFGLEFSNKTKTSFTYQVPDSPNAHLSGDVWERENAEYDESKITWSYLDDNEFEYFYSELIMNRRFKE